MKRISLLTLTVILIFTYSCKEEWDEHYNSPVGIVDQSIWTSIQENPNYSTFVDYMVEYGLDSLFETGGAYTIFVPTNEAFASFNTDTGDMFITLQYHLLDYVFNTINVDGFKQVRTVTGKFATVEEEGGATLYSESLIEYASPLHRDGRYYEINAVSFPLQNIYEYIAENTTVLKNYILGFDSVLLDLDKSTPLRFEGGEIIYDSVYTKVNYFDSIYFPVNREDRNKTATFILFDDEQYSNALDEMASVMGGEIQTGDDIPLVWREEVLIPDLIVKGLFPNSLPYEDLMAGRLKNVQGDSVDIDYTNISDDEIFASNGVIYKYIDFKIPEYLYRGEVRIEGEHMVDSVGSGIFFWKPEYTITGTPEAIASNPASAIAQGAENDSLVSLTFPDQPFNGEFNFEFYFKNMFPQKYLFVWGANYRPSGLYEVYVNDVLIREFDTFKLRQSVQSITEQWYYFSRNGNNRFDGIVDHLTEFGDVKITLKYVGVGGTSTITPLNGFSIDFISLIPID